MTKTLYIIRGLPGRGKTTLARQLSDAVYSEDDYWTDKDGSYHFNPDTRTEAFESMAASACVAMGYGVRRFALATAALSWDDNVIVDVIRQAESRGYTVHLIFLPLRPGRDNIHGVTDADMARFRSTMEHELEVSI